METAEQTFRDRWHGLTDEEQRDVRRSMFNEAFKTMSYAKAMAAVNSTIRNGLDGKLDKPKQEENHGEVNA